MADVESKKGLIIDPVIEWADRDAQIINELGIDLVYARKSFKIHQYIHYNFDDEIFLHKLFQQQK